MRLVQVIVPAGQRNTVLETLDDEGIDYVLTDETSGREYTGVVYFPLPTNAVEPVLESLREAGLDESAYTVVLDAETVISRRFEQLEEEYQEVENGHSRIAREELKVRAEDLASSIRVYVAMTVTSAVVATAGMLLDSPATVVGSMVIAPLIGPAMATAVGSVIDESDLFLRGAKMQVLGLVLTVISGAAFALFVKQTFLIPPGLDPGSLKQVQERLAPNFLSLAVGLGAGVAGAISLMTGVSIGLVGVMIAVAIVPPAAAVGIGIAYGDPAMAVSSGVMAIVNTISINTAALGVLWYGGYRPQHFFRRNRARTATIKRIGYLVIAILVLSAFLGGVTYDSYQQSQTEQEITDDARALFSEAPYEDLTLLGVSVEWRPQDPIFILHQPSQVIFTVGVPPDGQTEGVAEALETITEQATGGDVAVQVRFVTYKPVR